MTLAHYIHSYNSPLPAQYAGRSIAQVEANWRVSSHAQDPPQVPDHDLSSCMHSLRGGVGSNIWLYEPGIILSLHLARYALKKRTEIRTRLTRANVRPRLTRTHVRAKEEHATGAVIL